MDGARTGPGYRSRSRSRSGSTTGGASVARSAVTSPSIVCGSASVATTSPRARTVSLVMGPMDTTAGTGSGRSPTSSQKLVTVDDDVKVIASTAPSRTRARSAGAGVAVVVRYTGSTSTT